MQMAATAATTSGKGWTPRSWAATSARRSPGSAHTKLATSAATTASEMASRSRERRAAAIEVVDTKIGLVEGKRRVGPRTSGRGAARRTLHARRGDRIQLRHRDPVRAGAVRGRPDLRRDDQVEGGPDPDLGRHHPRPAGPADRLGPAIRARAGAGRVAGPARRAVAHTL